MCTILNGQTGQVRYPDVKGLAFPHSTLCEKLWQLRSPRELWVPLARPLIKESWVLPRIHRLFRETLLLVLALPIRQCTDSAELDMRAVQGEHRNGTTVAKK